jgi:hypothetical protein
MDTGAVEAGGSEGIKRGRLVYSILERDPGNRTTVEHLSAGVLCFLRFWPVFS